MQDDATIHPLSSTLDIKRFATQRNNMPLPYVFAILTTLVREGRHREIK